MRLVVRRQLALTAEGVDFCEGRGDEQRLAALGVVGVRHLADRGHVVIYLYVSI